MLFCVIPGACAVQAQQPFHQLHSPRVKMEYSCVLTCDHLPEHMLLLLNTYVTLLLSGCQAYHMKHIINKVITTLGRHAPIL